MFCTVIFKNNYGSDRALGELTAEGNTFRLSYRLNGDACLLEYDGKKAVQSRSGEFNTKFIFKENEITHCDFSDGANGGTLEVFTKKLAVTTGKAGVNLKLIYTLNGEEMRLEVTALAK